LTQAELATLLETNQPTISRWLLGKREPMGNSMERIRALAEKHSLPDFEPEEGRRTIPIMGYIGAGAKVDPDYEQVPLDGLDQVDLPLLLPDGVIGLQVRGDSMLPKYADGAVVVVHSEQGRSTTSLVGEEVAVRTYDGRRYLKVLMPGTKAHTYNLESFNARTITGVRIAWASRIIAIIPAAQVRPVVKPSQKRAAPSRAKDVSRGR
jgi:phage repressor protein C with HTH and peptisase S24 domain